MVFKFVMIFLLLCGYKIFATDLDVQLIITDTNYVLGDKISLQYKVEYDNNLRFILPDFSNISPHFECLSSRFDSTSKIFSVTLISFETGCIELPTVPFLFEDIGSKRLFTCLSPTYKLQIDSIKFSSNQIKEMEFEVLEERQWHWITILIVGIVLVVIIIVIIQKEFKITFFNKF